MKTLITYFIDNSTAEDYLFLLGLLILSVTIIRTFMQFNNNLASVQLSTFLY
jgi:hypothetical protein